MPNFTPGQIETMKVAALHPNGYTMTNGSNEVYLQENETQEELQEGDVAQVFLYENKQGKTQATMNLPKATLQSYGWAKVVKVVKNLGVFVDIGISRDFLVFEDDLPVLTEVWPSPGDYLYVTLGHDKEGRLTAKPITEQEVEEIRKDAPVHLRQQTLQGWVYQTGKVGSFVLTEEGYRGFIHYTERKTEPRLGQQVEGRVIAVKEDGTVNLSLRPHRLESMDEDAEKILNYLIQQGGKMPFGDKSDPEDIRSLFNLSKAAFKRSLGKLMKEGKIEQKDGFTFLKE
ncbi:S1 RNA-binding domain-containing protein [Thalassobacillus sp. C254]|uniref:CvfB family protein n=1 Tax=Thalassobacillus sp. C254 TaxID=1225341 RepID=UPI0006D07779|nr:S1-like domain-containing RNA-binding protein [Thalassobacillus sp. C254]